MLDVGSGPSVVFLHGLLGLNSHWSAAIELLRRQFRCICLEIPFLDLRGRDCSVPGIARLFERFLREYVQEQAVLLGSSIGGHGALKVAIDYPELVKGLVLAGSSGLAERKLASEDLSIRPTKEWLVARFGVMFHEPSKHVDQRDVDRVHEDLQDRGRARALVRLSKSARDNHLGDQLGRVRCPTLVLWGRNDQVTPPEAAEQFRDGIPDSRIVWLERCGHAPMIELPGEFAMAVAAFVRTLEPSEAA